MDATSGDVAADVGEDGGGGEAGEDAPAVDGADVGVPDGARDGGDAGDASDGGGCAFSCDMTHSLGVTCDSTGCHHAGCASGYADCNAAAPDLDGCETPTTTPTNCGGCGNACDTLTSAGAQCVGGSCTYLGGCASGYADCNTAAPNTNGCETSITTTSNCGGCGNACDTTNSNVPSCTGGSCHYQSCHSGYANCNMAAPDTNGCETSIATSPSNCGACGNVCDTTNSNGVTCSNGSCQHTTCAPGYQDCVSTAPDLNGCDTHVNTTSNCGNCGVACGTLNGTPGCNGSACTYACNGGYSNCNTAGSNTTGCECHTPGCCPAAGAGSTCQTTHTNGPSSIGLGQSWYDCVALNTYNVTQATAACYARFGAAGNCTADPSCGSGGTKVTQPTVCNFPSTGCTTCWSYGTIAGNYPTTAGTITSCACTATVSSLGTWN
jgi:hypothetical protein